MSVRTSKPSVVDKVFGQGNVAGPVGALQKQAVVPTHAHVGATCTVHAQRANFTTYTS